MNKQWSLRSLMGVSALLISSMVPMNGAPAIAQVFNAGNQIAQNILRQPKVDMRLSADRQIITKDGQGKAVRQWIATDNQVKVKSGDQLRFTVVAKNEGGKAAQNFAMTQPVPKGTTIVLQSASASAPATLTYSIDQGKTFVAQPIVKVAKSDGTVDEKPAPAEAYTHVRWTIAQALEPNANVNAAYQVVVR
jgi:uncharacterized repeat protein (TIGR01451 family)